MKRSPRNLKISFSSRRLTHYGGIYLLQKFFHQINLRTLFSQYVRFSQRNNRYTIAEEMLALLYPLMLGLGRLETTHLLKRNGVFQYLTGLPTYPNPTTLRRFLMRMAPVALPKLKKLHDKFLQAMILKPKPPTRAIFDLDSTVLTLYGRQEGAEIGYNPKKKGRPSYHPLLCFDGITRDFVHGELRSGIAHTATGIVKLLDRCFTKTQPSARAIFARADKGFYDHKTIEYLEGKRALFVIVARLTQPLRRKLPALKYRKYASGIETAELPYQPHNWQKEYRFVVVRRPVPEEPSSQLTLFTIGKFNYQVLVTNMKRNPLNTWKFYNKRAAIELIIKELKENYPLAKIPTGYFAANEAYFHILLFSYNLINWFKRLCLPKEFQNLTLKTLRYRLLVIPSELVRTANRPTLKLPANFLYKDTFEYALKKIENLRI